MPAQRRGRRDAEDIVEPVGATEVENLGSAIVAVAAHQDLYPRPVGANGAQQAAQKGLDLLAAGAFGRAQHSSDQTALAIEHDDRLKTVFVVVRIEQPQLLAAMNRVERVVDIQHDPLWQRRSRTHNKGRPSHARCATVHAHRAGFRNGRSSAGSIVAIRRRPIQRQLEHRIGAQRVGVVAVLITSCDHQQPRADDLASMRDGPGSARVLDAGGQAIAMPSRHSTSRRAKRPPSEESRRPSNRATNRLPATGDRPGSGSIG